MNINAICCNECGEIINPDTDRYFMVFEERLNKEKKKKVIGHYHPQCWQKAIEESSK